MQTAENQIKTNRWKSGLKTLIVKKNVCICSNADVQSVKSKFCFAQKYM